MKTLGRHLIAEYAECNPERLDDTGFIKTCMMEAVRKSGATIVDSVFHRYAPQGVSGVVVIAESHMSIHTWPEYGYAAVDFFTCGQTVDPYKAYAYLKEMLESTDGALTELDRGIPSEKHEVINHKPVPVGIKLSAAAGQ
ncbi:MAG: adenosylmethionine decarboxylase [candidate division Zixibacteria bacterium]|nr:adenosylmethionine decarboxylase [candidate division Zixibacteria bacterium]